MALVVEDGTGIADANSYVSVADCSAYVVARGLSFPISPESAAEAALIRATAAIDATYRSRFPGQRVNGRAQGLEWPRLYATDANGNQIADDEIPVEIINATCEAAVREIAAPGAMQPDIDRNSQIKSLQAGSVAITYSGAAPQTTVFQTIDGIMAPLLGAGTGNSYQARAVRG